MLDRIQIIQSLIRVTKAKNYLEIGVSKGNCFLKIKAGYKIAVDPSFGINFEKKLKWLFRNSANFNNHYFEQTSNDFFANNHSLLKRKNPKVVLVDGLHTYEQALEDVFNSLKFLEEGGVIVMHDCNPLTEAAGYRGESPKQVKSLHLPGWNDVWNGDVWKAVVHLRSLNPELEVFVLDCDHGIGIVRKAPTTSRLNFDQAQIKNLSYADLNANRSQFLNLKPVEYFEEFVARMAAQ
jgi:hypothetical protein